MSESSFELNSWRELDDASYTQLRRDLLRRKGSEMQRAFVDSLKSRTAFCSLIRNRVEVTEGDCPPTLKARMTESEFVNPPSSTERRLFEIWRNFTPAQASRTTFWGHVTLHSIEAGEIEPFFLVGSGSPSSGGLGRIHDVLRDGTDKQIDDSVRRCIRRFSGLQERGNRSVYSDGPFARAWWRCYWAHEICDSSQAVFRDIHRILSTGQSYWEELVNTVVSTNALMGDSKVRSALVWALSELDGDDASEDIPSDIFTPNGVRRMSSVIGIRSAWQELSVLSISELKKLMHDDIIRNTL